MNLRAHLLAGHVIPAQPLALDRHRKFSEKHQRALTRYYVAAGSGGLAVGVHSTQFAIRDPEHNLFRPVLELAAQTVRAELAAAPRDFALIAGEESIREVIAFPKNNKGIDLMSQSPGEVDFKQLRELYIKSAVQEKKS